MTRILIVDDHEANLYLLRALLGGHGYTVDEARNGAEALATARRNLPDIVVSDLLMPVLDGYTLLRHWRADDALRAVPFVVYTATYTEPKDERLAMALGADAFVIKPAEPDVLLARIQEILAGAARGLLPSHEARPRDDQALLQEYNEVLVNKLEKKTAQLEQLNHELRAEIAERKKTETEVAQTARLLRAVVDGTSDAVFVKGLDGKYLLFNEAAARVVGIPAEEVLGKDDHYVFGGESARIVIDNDRMVMESRRVYTVEENLIAAGTPRVFHALKAPYYDENGEVVGVIGVSRDITEHRKLEEQLRQSQKMEAIGRLAGGVAHDFNNLLTIIAGHSELLLDLTGASGADLESVHAIREAAERAAALTRQLLGFSRQTMLQPKVLDLNAVVDETGNMLRRLIGEDIQFTTLLAPDLAAVKVDPGQLDQVLMNLAVNARDAMPQGGSLTIETANVELGDEYADMQLDCRPGPHVMLAMTDTGCGMSREVQARIFEPFFTTKSIGKGTGLGLPMVFGIVQQSGGCIHVYSEQDRGTTFRIYLPAVDDAPAGVVPSEPLQDLRGAETVLLVEDDDGVRRLALRCLKENGYNVITAADGSEALRIAAAHDGALDLVLTDVVMPTMGGPELVERLHRHFPAIKVLFTSGYTDDAIVRHGLLTADVSFIQKPYTPHALIRKLRQVLDGH